MKLFSGTISTLENALNYSSLKQKVIAQNIANSDTPNYKAKDVNFKTYLNTAMNRSFSAKRTDQRHFDFSSNFSPKMNVVTKQSTSYHSNGNNVDMDKEMTELAKNQIYFNALTDRMNGKFQTLKSVIKGGGQ